MRDELQPERMQYEALAEFRHALRQFLGFSERAATRAGLQPQQHQLMLQIAGAPTGTEVTISYVAQRLGLRHHSAVELSKRCEELGLVARRPGVADGRQILLRVTATGQRALRLLSEDHARELDEMAPRLIRSLERIRQAHARRVKAEETR